MAKRIKLKIFMEHIIDNVSIIRYCIIIVELHLKIVINVVCLMHKIRGVSHEKSVA